MLRSILVAAVLATGCYAGEVRYANTTPDLVAVGPGVQVIADYDEPIFFAEGAYWWFYEGLWYRSSAYTGGWVYVSSPPLAVVNIAAPFRYVRYRPHDYVVRHRPVPSHRILRPTHRSPRADRPHIRDHRR